MAEFSGTPAGSGRRVAVVASRFNETITRALVDGALDALVRHNVVFEDIDVIWVPGAWELPLALRHATGTARYDIAIALGAVIRGDTPHFDYVAGEASRGIADASRDSEIPIGFGLLRVTLWSKLSRLRGRARQQGLGCRCRCTRDGRPVRQMGVPDED